MPNLVDRLLNNGPSHAFPQDGQLPCCALLCLIYTTAPQKYLVKMYEFLTKYQMKWHLFKDT